MSYIVIWKNVDGDFGNFGSIYHSTVAAATAICNTIEVEDELYDELVAEVANTRTYCSSDSCEYKIEAVSHQSLKQFHIKVEAAIDTAEKLGTEVSNSRHHMIRSDYDYNTYP